MALLGVILKPSKLDFLYPKEAHLHHSSNPANGKLIQDVILIYPPKMQKIAQANQKVKIWQF